MSVDTRPLNFAVHQLTCRTQDDKPTWKVTAATVSTSPLSYSEPKLMRNACLEQFPADSETQVAQRLVSEEPMSIIFNLHMSDSFQYVDLANLPFPSKLRIDYVRIYQREGEVNLSCSPKDYPTADYINE